jgi:hypothetical protein
VEPAAGAGIAADANRALGSVAVAELMREFTLSRSLRRRPVSVPVAVILGVARRPRRRHALGVALALGVAVSISQSHDPVLGDPKLLTAATRSAPMRG